jgi:oligosaccharyl transferase (archaeosortase A-associated)
MSWLRSTDIRTPALLFAFGGLALTLRVGISYDAVFGHDFVRFIETDAWYHMRLVDATVRHFPHRIWFDPYLVWPGGEWVNAGPFFDWLIAGLALLIGLGSPSSHLVDVVGAYVPPVLGALLVVPVYVLGRELFSRRAGLWAAFIVGVLPGQILVRSLLGFTDHHCAETLLSTTVLMWIVLAANASAPRQRRARSVAAGITLGCYLLTWGGGSLFVLIVVVAMGLNLILQRIGMAPADDLLTIVAPAFAVAGVMIVPWITTRPYFGYDVAGLVGGVLLLFALSTWGGVTASRRGRLVVYFAGLAAAAGLCLALAYVGRGGWNGLDHEIARLSPWRSAGYVREAMPLLRSPARYPLPLWNDFVTCLFLAVLGAFWSSLRPRTFTSFRSVLLFVWTGVLVTATFGQVRFAYYLAVNVALLSGLACDELQRSIEQDRQRVVRWATTAVLLLVVAVPAGARIRDMWGKDYNLSEDWYDALQWLQSHTPEPFASGDAYYRTDFVIPEAAHPTAYGVLAWWDDGYWIARVAHRIPNSNPKQTQVKEVAAFLMAQNPAEAAAVLDTLHSRYVIVDGVLQSIVPTEDGQHEALFPAIAMSAGRRPTEYCEDFELPGEQSTAPAQTYCFPDYYRTMAVRLYAFGGRAVAPQSIMAISWTDQIHGARRVKRLDHQMTFGTFEEAERYIASHPAEHWRIASADPLVSCVPLEALTDFRQAFRSIGRQRTSSGGLGPSAVQIYEYVRR